MPSPTNTGSTSLANKLIKEEMAWIIQDLWNEPRKRRTKETGFWIRSSEAAKAVRVVFDAIKAALHRGESVSIEGFGIFKVEAKEPRKYEVCYPFPLGTPPSKTSIRVIELKPEKKIVRFYPSKVLQRMLNDRSTE